MTFYYAIFAAVTLWALYDAFKRRAPFYWFLIVLFLPYPLGALAYLITFNRQRITELFTGSDLAELERRAAAVPSLENQLALADALESRGKVERAEPIYRHLLALEPNDLRATHGLARSLMSLGKYDEAGDKLARILAQDSAFADYSAALDYAEALARTSGPRDAVSLLDGLVTVQPRINHRLALAHYLDLDGKPDAARSELRRALEEFANHPPEQRAREERWAKRATKMLAELALKDSAAPSESP